MNAVLQPIGPLPQVQVAKLSKSDMSDDEGDIGLPNAEHIIELFNHCQEHWFEFTAANGASVDLRVTSQVESDGKLLHFSILRPDAAEPELINEAYTTDVDGVANTLMWLETSRSI